MKRSRSTTVCSSYWFHLPVLLFFTVLPPISSAYAAPVQGRCSAATDTKPRIALIFAFSGEADRFVDQMRLDDSENQFDGCVEIHGHRFSKGKLQGNDVVVVLTNISIVNAAMVTQIALDRFNIRNIIFSGIAGGVGGIGANDRDRTTANETPIGSVVIPKRWAFHQEMYFNNTAQTVPCAFLPGLQLNQVLQNPAQEGKTCNFLSGREPQPGRANQKARELDVELLPCAQIGQAGNCIGTPLAPAPQLIVGQNGVSGPTFVDNAQYRQFVATTLNFDEQGNRNDDTDVLVLDMETTASAMVAFSNSVPFIAVRSVSDLASGGEDSAAAQLDTFFAVAAENQAWVVLALTKAL